jgi:iron complex transport system substrate-binding protein
MGLSLHRIVRSLFLFVITMIAILACHNSVSSPPSSTQPDGTGSSCRMVQHAMGETCVPANPQRIVALSGFAVDAVFSLGFKPVGVVTNVSTLWKDEMQGVELLGLDEQFSLEKILALQPDLILSSQWNTEAVYDKLAAIAPTVVDGAILGEWKTSFMLHAEALGKTEEAEQLMREYQQQIKDLQKKMGDKVQQTSLSLIRIYPDGLGLYLKNSFAGTILDEIGFSRPPSQNKGIVGQLPFQEVISKERIKDADGDAIFIWAFGATSDIAQSAQNALQQIQNDPLWLQLNAVQKGNVYVVKDYWHVASTPTQAMLVVDDLEQYLLEKQMGSVINSQIETQCLTCDYLMVICANTGRVIESYAPGIYPHHLRQCSGISVDSLAKFSLR